MLAGLWQKSTINMIGRDPTWLATARSVAHANAHLECQVRLRGLVHVCELGLARVPAVGCWVV